MSGKISFDWYLVKEGELMPEPGEEVLIAYEEFGELVTKAAMWSKGWDLGDWCYKLAWVDCHELAYEQSFVKYWGYMPDPPF